MVVKRDTVCPRNHTRDSNSRRRKRGPKRRENDKELKQEGNTRADAGGNDKHRIHCQPKSLCDARDTATTSIRNNTKLKSSSNSATQTAEKPKQQPHKRCKYCDCQPSSSKTTYLIETIQRSGYHRHLMNVHTLEKILKCPVQRNSIGQTDSKGLTALVCALRHQKRAMNTKNNDTDGGVGGSGSRWFEIIRLLVQADNEKTSLFQQSESVMIPLMECIDSSCLLEIRLPYELYQATQVSDNENTFQDLFHAFSLGLSMNAKFSSATTDTLRFLICETYRAAFGDTRKSTRSTHQSNKTPTPPLLHMFLYLAGSHHIGTIRRMEPFFPYQVLLPIFPICTTIAIASSIMDQYPHMTKLKDSKGNTPLHIVCGWSNAFRRSQPYEAAYKFVNGCNDTGSNTAESSRYGTVGSAGGANTNLPSTEQKRNTDLQRLMCQMLERHGEPFERIVNELLENYPDAARQANRDGDLPLHVALKKETCSITATSQNTYNYYWKRDGLTLLFESYPKSITIPDSTTRLLPFMIVASNSAKNSTPNERINDTETMNTIYHLIRENPCVLSSAVPS